jgi:hypothetical protein
MAGQCGAPGDDTEAEIFGNRDSNNDVVLWILYDKYRNAVRESAVVHK